MAIEVNRPYQGTSVALAKAGRLARAQRQLNHGSPPSPMLRRAGTDKTDEEAIHEELSGKIIGAAMGVLNELRPGLDEKLYEHAMIIELKHRGHSLSIQRAFPVLYRGELIGNLIPDLIVDDAVIVDPKVVACFTDTHVAQIVGYLNIKGLDLALVLNFKNARLEWKRVLRPREAGEYDTPDLHA